MTATTALLDCIEIETAPNPTHAVIWCMACADGNDFAPIVPELDLPDGAAVRFVFPNAPVQRVTINNGMAMRSWYDILVMDLVRVEDGQGIRASEAAIRKLIARENARGIPTSKIVLAGFSQLRHDPAHRHPPARETGGHDGPVRLPALVDTAEAERHGANQDTPIFLAHGQYDPWCPWRGPSLAGRIAAAGLRRALAHLPDAALGLRRGSGRHLHLPARRARLSQRRPDGRPASGGKTHFVYQLVFQP